jgi:hypothetical protein
MSHELDRELARLWRVTRTVNEMVRDRVSLADVHVICDVCLVVCPDDAQEPPSNPMRLKNAPTDNRVISLRITKSMSALKTSNIVMDLVV